MRLSRRCSSHPFYVLTLLLSTMPFNHHDDLALTEPYSPALYLVGASTTPTSPSITTPGAALSSSSHTPLTTPTTTSSRIATTTIQRALSTTPIVQSTSPTPQLSSRCKLCPLNNTSGLTCFKNTQCVPVSLLCNITATPTTSNQTATTNLCLDTTGVPSPDDPITCRDQLCYPDNYLPLPAPGSGKIDSNSSANCESGNYFALYGSASGGMRYTRSCIAKFPAVSTAISCYDWEYQAQNSCLLKTCGPGMDCEKPFICRKRKSSPAESFGLCANPNSTDFDDGNGVTDGTTDRDRLILGVLVGVCTLVLAVGIGAVFWHFRKTRLKLLGQLNTEDNDHGLYQKTLLLYVCCCCLGAGTRNSYGRGGGALDDGATVDESARDPRVTPEESESQVELVITEHRSNIIFSRRWRWGQGLSETSAGATTNATTGITTAGGIAVVPEIEPPPIYHQESELPSYGDNDAIPLGPIHPVAADTSEITPATEGNASANDEIQVTISTPGPI